MSHVFLDGELGHLCANVPSAQRRQAPVIFDASELDVVIAEVVIGHSSDVFRHGVAEQDRLTCFSSAHGPIFAGYCLTTKCGRVLGGGGKGGGQNSSKTPSLDCQLLLRVLFQEGASGFGEACFAVRQFRRKVTQSSVNRVPQTSLHKNTSRFSLRKLLHLSC